MANYLLLATFAFLVLFSFGIASVMSGRTNLAGSAVMIDSVTNEFSSAISSSYLYFFLAITALGVVLNAGYQRLKTPAKLQRLVAKAKRHIKEGAVDKAITIYEETRMLYENMTPEEKLRSYNDIMEIYNNLLWHYKAKNAQKLADKYAKGTLSQDELKKLELLLQN